MAQRTVKKKRSTAKASPAGKRSRTNGVTTQRKREVLGITVMAIAVLMGVAISSYSPADRVLVEDVALLQAFDPAVAPADNLLGILGAHLGHYAVPMFLGFPVLGLSLLLFVWGYVALRGRTPGRLLFLTGLLVIGLFVVSTTIGWISQVFSVDLGEWSGMVGQGLSLGLSRAVGTVGTGIVLAVLVAVLLLVGIDRDLHHTINRVEHWFAGLGTLFSQYRERRRVRRMQKKEDRQDAAALRERERATAKPEVEKNTTETRPSPVSKNRQHLSPGRQATGTVNDLFRAPLPPGSDKPILPATSTAPPVGPAVNNDPDNVAFSIHKPAEEKHADIDRNKRSAHVKDYPYQFPSVELLDDDTNVVDQVDIKDLEEKKQIVLNKLADHSIELQDIEAIVGPTVTLFELKPKPGIKISQIKSLENDLAMALAARGIRMIAPIPGKSAVGLEIPNRHRELVRIRSVLTTERFRDTTMELPTILGKTIQNEVYLADLTKMPHLLIAGATGSGKSVGLNCLIITLLYACHPSDLKFVMIDPKKIELQQYANIVDHYIAMPEDAEEPITTDFAHALGLLKSCIKEMDHRYDLLSTAGVRGIKQYNERLKEGRIEENGVHHHLPHLVIIIDELADLMMTAGKEIEAPIARLAQMARAVGLHLVVATQRPSVNVITGLIKANFPSRVAYQVATGIDSRTIMDQYGAEQLVGNGDMLFMKGSQVLRLQSPYISLDEVERVTRHIGAQEGPGPYYLPPAEDAAQASEGASDPLSSGELDELFDEAAHIIVRSQQGSVSLLQRKLSVGYTRAARIVDQLEDAGIVGPFEGSKARQVLIADELDLEAFLQNRQAQ